MSESNPWWFFSCILTSQRHISDMLNITSHHITSHHITTCSICLSECLWRFVGWFLVIVTYRGANPFDDDQQQSSEPHYLTNGTDRQDNHQPLRGDNLSPNYDDGRPRPPILANYMYKVSSNETLSYVLLIPSQLIPCHLILLCVASFVLAIINFVTTS